MMLLCRTRDRTETEKFRAANTGVHGDGRRTGKPIKECQMVMAVLIVLEPKEDLPLLHQQGQAARR